MDSTHPSNCLNASGRILTSIACSRIPPEDVAAEVSGRLPFSAFGPFPQTHDSGLPLPSTWAWTACRRPIRSYHPGDGVKFMRLEDGFHGDDILDSIFGIRDGVFSGLCRHQALLASRLTRYGSGR
jgi:hypothetical protein